MRHDEHFWWITLVRGFVALVAGSAIAVIPDMARTLLLLPIAITVSILGLAVYGVLDSVLVFITSYTVTSRLARVILRLQGAIGITLGILIYRVFFFSVQLYWFLILISIQSLSTAVAEFLLARHSMTPSTSRLNFTAAVVACGFSCSYIYLALKFAGKLLPQQITWLVYGYLVAFGLAQCVTAARMLYADRTIHPPGSASQPFK